VSEDCGERFALADLRVLSHTFDSVRIVSTTPKASGRSGTNIEVFRCPEPSVIKVRFLSVVKITSILIDGVSITPLPGQWQFLPLNTSAKTTTITFEIEGVTPAKNLVVNYDVDAKTLFNACKEQLVVSNLSVKADTTVFSQVKVIRTTVVNPNHANVEITL
jgi:hypothetical protein